MLIVRSADVPANGFAKEFAGEVYGVGVSFLIVEAQPGVGPATHQHDYPEVIIVQQGQARCVVGGTAFVANAGDVVFIAANEPHSFFNSGDGPLVQIDIHLRERFETRWLASPSMPELSHQGGAPMTSLRVDSRGCGSSYP